ncbi:uncharacterized protein L969DRAFT_87803 [Mixia osmundae IAM 14324]|uniref:OPT family small oligopeptide transporter n=1 Tax=Mixia osmundae (strain CBS 9802 / IAM 14324 / JCM 22182 / KY 12970) TaxID=764103 RepID=G7DYW8_MIXOS|nr:uncharacterized protein L969DRAFT_87803 [Mixia osmundae IAM 14324]KEI38609.1 hypothetical protein L969DRAFT_87803 [Mixia osmundae IAM 14324]GAA95778.1 hypothetical protein E5Q_02435 [Mixia osmundae IAM 14324]
MSLQDPGIKLAQLSRADEPGDSDVSEDAWLLDDEIATGKGVSTKGSAPTDRHGPDGLSIVPTVDDPALPHLTLRVLLIGTLFCIVGAAISQLFYFKSNAPKFSVFLIILVTLPLGKWCAALLPNVEPIQGWPLNPGPFSVKEHVLITVLAGSGATSAYAGDILAVQDLYYHQNLGAIAGIGLLVTTQVLGFALAGSVYRLLVRPTKLVWPSTLVLVSLFLTLHADETTKTLTQVRLRFFSIAFVGCFLWQFVPAVLSPTLTSLAVLCIALPRSEVVETFGSGYRGFGLGTLSLDWSVVGAFGGLFTPWFASVNFFAGLVFMCWVFGPGMWLTDFWNASKFSSPIGSGLYDTSFSRYNVTAIINATDLSLDVAAYEKQGAILLTPFFAMTYAASFAILTAAVTSVICWNLDLIKDAVSSSPSDDIHVQLLEQNYPPVPHAWYISTGVITLAASCGLVLLYPMQLPVWALVFAVAIAAVFLVPLGIVAGITNTTIGLNVISELVAGFVIPGLPIGVITFKVYTYMVYSQCLALVGDLKFGLYMKIPPRSLFIAQLLGTTLGAIVNYVFIRIVLDSKRQYLDGSVVDPQGQWDGRAPQVFYSASVIWGLLGPARFFSGDYALLYWGFLGGAIMGILPWLLNRIWPRNYWQYVSAPVFLHGCVVVPAVPTNTITVGFAAAFLSQFWAARYHREWHEKFNYVLSAALDAATSINAMSVFLLGLSFYAWWGNPPSDSEHCQINQ